MEEQQKPRSLFEVEAERMLNLNKAKHKSDEPFSVKAMGWAFGIGVVTLFFVFVIVPITIYSVLSHAYVGMKLWQWFMVPLGMKAIGFWNVAGISMLIRLFTYEGSGLSKSSSEKSLKGNFAYMVGLMLIPWFTLLLGYIVHLFM